MVLQTLKWDVAAVTPCDLVDVILSQLPMIDVDRCSQHRADVRHHALTFVVLCVLGTRTSCIVFADTCRNEALLQCCMSLCEVVNAA